MQFLTHLEKVIYRENTSTRTMSRVALELGATSIPENQHVSWEAHVDSTCCYPLTSMINTQYVDRTTLHALLHGPC